MSEIKLWMERNMLKPNDDKTALINSVHVEAHCETVAGESIQVGSTVVEISLKAKKWKCMLYLSSHCLCNFMWTMLPV